LNFNEILYLLRLKSFVLVLGFSGFPPSRIRVNLMILRVVPSSYKTHELSERHSREGGNPGFLSFLWTPAFAGVTVGVGR
jgi:hypothetical protein